MFIITTIKKSSLEKPKQNDTYKNTNQKIRNENLKSPNPKVYVSTPTVRLMITKEMRRQLTDLGYTKSKIDNLTPEIASIIIRNEIGPLT